MTDEELLACFEAGVEPPGGFHHREHVRVAFAERYPELLAWKPSILDRYYTTETLTSDRARRTFVMPDRLSGGH